jgi:hypothetical protein
MGQAKLRKQQSGTSYGAPIKTPRIGLYDPVGEITPAVLEFQRSIDPSSYPQKISVRPSAEAMLLNCHENIRARVAEYGGSQIFGWAVEEQKNIYLHCCCHSVWISPDGSLVDLTPQHSGDAEILFCHDSNLTYEIVTKDMVRKSKLIPLQPNDEMLTEYLDLVESHSDPVYRIRFNDTPEFISEAIKISRLSARLTLRYGTELYHDHAHAELRRMAQAERLEWKKGNIAS